MSQSSYQMGNPRRRSYTWQMANVASVHFLIVINVSAMGWNCIARRVLRLCLQSGLMIRHLPHQEWIKILVNASRA